MVDGIFQACDWWSFPEKKLRLFFFPLRGAFVDRMRVFWSGRGMSSPFLLLSAGIRFNFNKRREISSF